MQSFLEHLAEYHIRNNISALNEYCFVFPGRRAGLFFNKFLSQKIQEPVWAPKTLTISEFFGLLTPNIVSDSLSLVFRLYLCYKKVMKSDITVDDFLPFGEMLLSDFNDIDKYMADAEKLFVNLADIKSMEDDYSYLSEEQVDAIRTFWSSFNPHKLSQHQKYFVNTWENLFELYYEFNRELNLAGEAYEGMIYRTVANRVTKNKTLDIPFQHIVFAGFNALNSCEKIVFNYLKIHKRASFFWDYPQWVMDLDKKLKFGRHINYHEAISFVSQNIIDFAPPDDWVNPNPDGLPVITISAAPNDMVQAQISYNFLNKTDTTDTITNEKTALVLADEGQLLSVIHSIPEKIEKVNVTLGYPLKSTPAYGLLENILALQKSARTTKEGKTWFYHRPLLSLLQHQYMGLVIGESTDKIINQLVESNQIFVLSESLGKSDKMKSVFRKIESPELITDYLRDILFIVYQSLKKNNNTEIEREFVYHLYTILNRLNDIISSQEFRPSPETWLTLFKRIAEQQTVPFKGEPLSGLQIMGILETRALDFDKILIISMNEGVFPKSSAPNTFIPFNLRKGHGLPTKENQDAIFAYYFYRLINRAKEVNLIYSTTKTVTGEGEMSRFLQQLYYEYPGSLTISQTVQKVNIQQPVVLFASKKGEIIEKIKQWTIPGKSSLSPSALSNYIECPLRFYYKYIAVIKEQDTINEDLDPRVFGNLFHQIIETLFSPFKGQTIAKEELQNLLVSEDKIKAIMIKTFKKNKLHLDYNLSIFSDLQGKNSLIYEVLYKYIKQFIRKEMDRTPFKLINLEKKVPNIYCLEYGKTVNLEGTIDRIDLQDDIFRIIDYKTGNTEQVIKDISDLFDTKKHTNLKAIFQTLLYCLIISDEYPDKEIAPGIISVKKLFSDSYSLDIYLKEDKKQQAHLTLKLVKEPFKKLLNNLLKEILDTDKPFEQTSNPDNCRNCLFTNHCFK